MCIFLKLNIQESCNINWWKPLQALVPAKIPPTVYERRMNERNEMNARAANSQGILQQYRPSGSIQRGLLPDFVWTYRMPLSVYDQQPPIIPMSFSERPPIPRFGTHPFFAPVMPRQQRPRLTRGIRHPFWRVRHMPPPQWMNNTFSHPHLGMTLPPPHYRC